MVQASRFYTLHSFVKKITTTAAADDNATDLLMSIIITGILRKYGTHKPFLIH